MKEIEKLAEVIAEIDHLTNEGVVFQNEDIRKMDQLCYDLDIIIRSVKKFNTY